MNSTFLFIFDKKFQNIQYFIKYFFYTQMDLVVPVFNEFFLFIIFLWSTFGELFIFVGLRFFFIILSQMFILARLYYSWYIQFIYKDKITLVIK